MDLHLTRQTTPSVPRTSEDTLLTGKASDREPDPVRVRAERAGASRFACYGKENTWKRSARLVTAPTGICRRHVSRSTVITVAQAVP